MAIPSLVFNTRKLGSNPDRYIKSWASGMRCSVLTPSVTVQAYPCADHQPQSYFGSNSALLKPCTSTHGAKVMRARWVGWQHGYPCCGHRSIDARDCRTDFWLWSSKIFSPSGSVTRTDTLLDCCATSYSCSWKPSFPACDRKLWKINTGWA